MDDVPVVTCAFDMYNIGLPPLPCKQNFHTNLSIIDLVLEIITLDNLNSVKFFKPLQSKCQAAKNVFTWTFKSIIRTCSENC